MSIQYPRLVPAFFLALLISTAARPAAAQPVVADGFEDSLVTAVSYPTAIAVVADGRVLISSQLGQLYVYKSGTLLETPALDLGADVCTYRERGLLGLAVDPAFATNHFIYLAYVARRAGDCDAEWAGAPVSRVSRFVLNDDDSIDRASEKVLIDNVPSVVGIHNVDDVEFGRDGYLYISVGDGGCDYADDSGCFESNDAARDLNVLLGKVLRITRDGGIPSDNPFTGAGTAPCAATGGTESGLICQEIFATGLRNPWRLAFDPNAPGTRFFINDVGQDTWEEINEGRSGADYGWNLREGFCGNGSTECSMEGAVSLTNPLYSYDRNDGCASITGGAFVPNGAWGADFDGVYLFSDYVCGSIFKLVSGGDGSFAREVFVSGLGDSSATDLYFVTEGDAVALYYTSYANGGEVRRIRYVGGSNRRPRATLTAIPSSGSLPLVVNFDATGSSDPDGDDVTYEWNFGDGQTLIAGPRVEHSYGWEGTYYITVSVKDPHDAAAIAAIFVDAGNTAPEPAILSPLAAHTFAVGESITLRGRGNDAEDGELPDRAFTWRVLLHHNTHTHGFIPPTGGNAISFTAPGPENLRAAGTSYLEVQLTATDSQGLTRTISQELRPRTAQLTFASNPSGATLQIGHERVTAPFTVSSWVNYAIAVDAPSLRGAGNDTELTLHSWSDGGAARHTIVTPETATTYTATFGAGTPPPVVPGTGTRGATASSVETPDFQALNAIDGNPSTRWASTYSDPQWLTIDLGAILTIDRVVLSWEGAYATAYMIQVSDNASAWTTVHQTTSGDGGTDDIGGLDARGRYVRMFATERATPWGYSLWEFQVFERAGGGGAEPEPGAPLTGTPVALPGTIEVESFDGGPSGVSYLDSTPGNSGGEYRNTDVDIEFAADTDGGHNIGWLDVGEWLKYTVNVGAAGSYNLEFRVASAAPGGTFHLEVNGVDKTGPLTIPSTGDWQSWTTLTKGGVSLVAGEQVWRLVFDSAGAGGAIGNFNYIRVTGGATSTPTATTPHNGVRTTLPGVLQAEAFDDGGPSVAYNDTTSGNSGGEARSDDVDIERTADAGGGFDIGWIAPGEWLNYSVNVTAPGIYTLEFRVAASGAGGIFHLEVNGVDVTGPLTIPDTGDWQSWTTVSKSGVALTAGNQVWRLVIDSARSVVGNLNYIRVLAGSPGGGTSPPGSSASPYGGTAVSLPGTLQAEHFDEGPASVAYADTTAGNSGGKFRPADVDIESTSDAGDGFNVGWVEAGEWLGYTVNVAAAGTYDLEVRVASAGAGGSFHIEVNGADKTGPLTLPDTGGWQSWTTVRSGITLGAGLQVLRLVMDTNGATSGIGNFNWIRVAAPGVQPAIAIQRGPYLQQVTDASAVVAWTTRTQGTAAVRYSGPAGAVTTAPAETRLYSASETGLAFDYFQHEAHLVGLSPQSSYSYDIMMAGADVTPGQHQFSTAPPTGSGTVRFIAFSDSGVGSTAQTQLATRMTNDTFDIALHGGDVAYGGSNGLGAGSYQQFEDWVFGAYKAWMPSRPFFPSIGNHDDEADAARPYRDVFVLPENGARSGRSDHAERYYSFDYGPVHFVALDTETAFLDPVQRQAQLAWLDADLAATSQSWRVVYFHKPPYSSGRHHGSSIDVRTAFSPIFEKHHVQLVISGHEHIYERSVPIRQSAGNASGVTYIVTGGGGAPLTDAGSDWWTAFSASVHHYVRATAGDCTLRMEAVRLDGVVFDSFELDRCTVAGTALSVDVANAISSGFGGHTQTAPGRRLRASASLAPARARGE